MNPEVILSTGKVVISHEAAALQDLSENLDASFVTAVQLILKSTGRVIVTGIGKSGHVGRKIAATLASLGTPAFFVHTAETVHGDLGMITKEDVVLLLTHSGETAEILNLLAHLQPIGCALIAITGNPASTLAKAVNIHLDSRVRTEADSRGLAPTTSATATLALGDALALTLADAHGFTRSDFHRLHPGGSLGRQLSKQPSGGSRPAQENKSGDRP